MIMNFCLGIEDEQTTTRTNDGATKDMLHCYFWPGEYVEKWNRRANNETTIS